MTAGAEVFVTKRAVMRLALMWWLTVVSAAVAGAWFARWPSATSLFFLLVWTVVFPLTFRAHMKEHGWVTT